MKYKAGDEVRVRNDLKINIRYGKNCFVGAMADLKGKIVTIKQVFDNHYEILEDNNTYYWTDEMLEDVKESKDTTENITIEQLQIKLKKKDAQIAYLKGQLHVYKEVLKLEEKKCL